VQRRRAPSGFGSASIETGARPAMRPEIRDADFG
jgi:hypothetical protein